MLKTFEIMEQIRKESKKTGKAEIIARHQDNEKFIRLAIFLLDTNVKTNLSTNKIDKIVDMNLSEPISDFESFLDYLAFDCSGTNVNIASVQNFIRQHSTDVQEFLRGIATKSYKIGVSASGFNKVVKIIETHKVQRAKLYSDEYHKLDKKYPGTKYYFTEKLDGIRCTAFVCDSAVKTLSRNNKDFFGLSDIFTELKEGIYDGEFFIPGKDFNYVQSIVMSEDPTVDKSEVMFKMFDFITHNEYADLKGEMKYSERRELMDSMVKTLPERVEVVDCLDSCYYSELDGMKKTLFEMAMRLGWEGLMVNIGDSPYQFKKTDAILKVKEFETIDLPIIGFNEGEGRLKGTTGSIRCEYKGFTVDVPSMKDEMRAEFWNNQEKYIGKTIEVKYFQESTNEKGGLSLRFPSFVRLREDK